MGDRTPAELLRDKLEETLAEPVKAERVGDEFVSLVVRGKELIAEDPDVVASVVDAKYDAGAATIYVPGLGPLGSTVEMVIGPAMDEDPV